ncbi:serine carboxypeptidase-like 18 [Argentina anserina]|uniref:serine carboxypeptidase-like 18 n=1 Tax=Argentina anserina TaxID=57926 RepID=UPI0021765C99|nr:serine carboxypeptidase-like 18 [Potentilla anserina]
MAPERLHCLEKYIVPLLCLHAVLLSSLCGIATSQTIVTSLPGYEGDLPFTLETGYVGVGDSNTSQLFYYFVESQRSPAEDPLMLWFTGGPGCSVLSAFFYESGPLSFTYVDYNGSLPSLHLNPYAWTQGLNMIYVDSPVGTGFSYSTTQEGYYIDDQDAVAQSVQFLRRWLLAHPQFLNNILYIGGDSYSGIPLPMIVQQLYNGNDEGVEPYLNLRGYILGNPKTDDFIDVNSVNPFAHRLTLISDELYESTKESCGGDYVNVDDNNTACVTDLATIDQLLLQINLVHVLEPNCQVAFPNNREEQGRRSIRELPENLLTDSTPALWCRYYNYVLLGVWANDHSVREALNVSENSIGVWKRCNMSIAYTKTVTSSIDYHKNLSDYTNLRALVYSGDHDMSVPHVGTQEWIRYLNLTNSEIWRPWYVDGQVAGYSEKFSQNDYNLQFATVKGAGHVAPEYKAKECYAMIDRWLAYYPL